MRFLCIDWGNTQVKAAIMDEPDAFIAHETFSAADAPAKIQQLLAQYEPKASILSTVVADVAAVEAALQEKTHYVRLSDSTHLPVMNAYHSPNSLGMDRLAAVAGAYAAFPDKNNLVVALGTCATYNFITKNGAFRGGAISPGLQMRLHAMHSFTDGLPEVSRDGDTLLLGYDTATCMRSGAVFGLAAEIDGMIQAFEKEYGEFNAVLTGGDAPVLARHIKSRIFADPQIILKGLYQILKHNARFLR